MIQFFTFLIEVNICITLFYTLYLLLVKNDTFHSLKRFYLLVSVAISLLIPQLPSTKWSNNIEKTIIPHFQNSSNYLNYHDTFEKVVFGSVPKQIITKKDPGYSINIFVVLFFLYFYGISYMLARFINNLYQIRVLVKNNTKEPYGNYILITLNNHYPTFSFFKYIFFNGESLNNYDKSIVLSHEEIHIKQWHSIDIIFIELSKIVFWFNPIIWLYKKSLIKVHECLADERSVDIKSGNIQNYQALLLKQYLNNFNIELAHPFNYSLIKFRIKMMTKTKSSKWAKFKLIFAIPIIIIGLVAFTKADLNLPSQEKSQSSKSNTNIENQPVGMAFIPQGTFILKREDGNKIKDLNVSIEAFWMRENEVTVKEYLEFTESIKKDSAKNVYEATLPNRNKVPFNDYYTNIKYYNFPMVGVTLHQAQNYCLWITAKMNLELKKQGKPLVYSSRLPAEAEWIYASFGGLNPDKIVKPQITFLTKIGSKKPNEWGLNNMFDNVSEWTNTSFDPEKYMTEVQYFSPLQINKIIVKGNNYKNLATNDMLILDGNDSYDYVGFRYVRSYSSEN